LTGTETTIKSRYDEGRVRKRQRADQERAASVATLVRPVPAQALQTIRVPRSRTRPVPLQRVQVFWMIGAGRLLCIEKRFPKTILNCLCFFGRL
jgi:hypothetical protein